jgi:hypothetical protein
MEAKELLEQGYDYIGDAYCNKKKKLPLQIWINELSQEMVIYDPKSKAIIFQEFMEERYQK